MAVAKEIYDALVSEYPDSMKPIAALSRNEQGGKDFVISEVLAFNFDDILCFGAASQAKEKSPDALFVCGDVLYLVEFKEGRCERSDIRQKIHEGILTLYHYARSRGLAKRSSFFDLKIKYAVIRRPGENKGSRFLELLEESSDNFSLKNMRGWLLQDTAVRWKPDSILGLLHKISDGSVSSIDVVSSDQATRETVNIA